MVIIGPIEHAAENIVFTSDNVQLKIGNELLSSGILHLTESSLSWRPVDSVDSISIPWQEIGVHAVSSNPVKCIYFMIDNVITWPGVYDPGARPNGNRNGAAGGGGNASNDDSDDEGNESDCEPEMTEFWLIPSDQDSVNTIFQSMTECQALHPDPCDSVSEDEGGFMGMDEEVADEIGPENMRNLQINEDENDQFADAEED